jgi:hypothetical protein
MCCTFDETIMTGDVLINVPGIVETFEKNLWERNSYSIFYIGPLIFYNNYYSLYYSFVQLYSMLCGRI